MAPPPDLPPPKGPLAHLHYSWRALRRRRSIGRAIELLDERLRAAVAVRDERLAALGEATLSQRAGGTRARAFSETLDRLDTEHGNAEDAWESARLELATAEEHHAEARAHLEREEQRLHDAERPVRRALEAARKATAELDKAIAANEDQRKTRRSRLSRVEEKLASATDDEARAELVAERTTLEQRLEALEAEVEPNAEALEQARADVVAHEAELEGIEDELKHAREDGEAAVAAAKAQVQTLEGEVDLSKQRVERLVTRRRAVLMDLGHEVLHAFPEDQTPAQESARASVARIDALRAERDALEQQRDAVQLAPIKRTAKALLLSLGVALALWWVL